MQAFNATTQQLEDVTWSTGKDNEIICTFENDHFYKFAAGTTKEEIISILEKQRESNEGQRIITPEEEAEQAAQNEAAQQVVDELNEA